MRHQVVIQTAFLGDAVLSLPLVRGIRLRFPNDGLILVCRAGLAYLESGECRNSSHRNFKAPKVSWPLNACCAKKNPRLFYRTCFLSTSVTSLCVSRTVCECERRARRIPKLVERLGLLTRIPRPSHLPDALRQLSLLEPFDSALSADLKKIDLHHPLANSQGRAETVHFQAHEIPSLIASYSRKPVVTRVAPIGF